MPPADAGDHEVRCAPAAFIPLSNTSTRCPSVLNTASSTSCARGSSYSIRSVLLNGLGNVERLKEEG